MIHDHENRYFGVARALFATITRFLAIHLSGMEFGVIDEFRVDGELVAFTMSLCKVSLEKVNCSV